MLEILRPQKGRLHGKEIALGQEVFGRVLSVVVLLVEESTESGREGKHLNSLGIRFSGIGFLVFGLR